MSLSESLHAWQDRVAWGKYLDDVRMPDPELQAWWDGLHPNQQRAVSQHATAKDPPPTVADARAWGAVVDAYLGYVIRASRTFALIGLPIILAAMLLPVMLPRSPYIPALAGPAGAFLGMLVGGAIRLDRIHRRRRDLLDQSTREIP